MVGGRRARYARARIMSDSSSGLSRFGRGLKAAAASLAHTPTHFTAAEKAIVCPHCGGCGFDAREILLNTRGATFMKLDWLNHGATALTCQRCRRIEWFHSAPTPQS